MAELGVEKLLDIFPDTLQLIRISVRKKMICYENLS